MTTRRRGLATSSILALLALPSGVGCSAGYRPAVLWAAGSPGPVAARVEGSRLAVPVSLNDHATAYLVVDTYAPVTLLDRRALPGVALDRGMNELASLRVGTLEFRDVRAVATDGSGAVRSAGALGADVIAQYPVSLDYRGRTVVIGDADPPASAADGETASIPFQPAGGGVRFVPGAYLPRAFAATRVLVPVQIEGRACTMVLDTGDDAVVVDSQLFEAFARDGRRSVGTQWVRPLGAAVPVRVTRVRSIRVGGLEVSGVPVAGAGSGIFSALGREVGQPVCGLLGGDFLRDFYVTVDFPRGVLRLRRYTAHASDRDRYTHAGFWLERTPEGSAHAYRVARVVEGSDAASQGVTVGDAVISVDGRPLDPMETDEAEGSLGGPVGTVHDVVLERGAVRVRVEELLPAP